jgi:26S proteasome regulatory subunit N11
LKHDSRNKAKWSEGFKVTDTFKHCEKNESVLKDMAGLTADYNNWIQDEMKKTKEELVVSTVGKVNPRTHLAQHIEETMTSNIIQCMGTMLDTLIF